MSNLAMTPDEEATVRALAEAWNAFMRLPVEHPDDVAEFRHGLHTLQDKVLSRPARRAINLEVGMAKRLTSPRSHQRIMLDESDFE